MAVKMSKPQPRDKAPNEVTDEERTQQENQDSESENADRGETQNQESPPRRNGTPASQSEGKKVRVDRDTLIMGLNHDLSGEYQAVIMYTHYAAKLTGPFRKELRSLFQGEVTDEQGHAQFLADKIAALGGEPTTQPRPVISADNPRAMLENALAAEKQAIADYRIRIDQAEAFGDVGLKVELENQIADETRHKEEMERILAGWK
jgi:bacterioferritin